jgi:hypothetical protein
MPVLDRREQYDVKTFYTTRLKVKGTKLELKVIKKNFALVF